LLIDPEPTLPTRDYRILCHDSTLIDLEAEAMWPMGTQFEWTITTLVIGLPRPGGGAAVQASRRRRGYVRRRGCVAAATPDVTASRRANPCLRGGLNPGHGGALRVEQIAIAPAAEAPMQIVTSGRALAGRGIEGDRYASNAGTFSPRAGRRSGYELTLIAAEVVEEITARDAHLDFASTRRNILTRGIDVNALVGRDFSIGDVRCHGLRLAEPCAHLERLTGPGLLRPLIHRGGLRADIVTGGAIEPESPLIS
jgi:hypothetical protein